ncbi:MAG: hypothetical protein ACPGFK_00625 [Flavobacteriaceae bacterium]
MRADVAVYHILKNNADVTSIVSTNIFPNVVPQGVTASDVLTYHISNIESYDTKSSYNDYHRCDVQVSCFSKNSSTAADLQEKVRVAMERYKGVTGTNTTVTVDYCFFDSAEDMGYLKDVDKYHKVVNFKLFIL